MYINTYLLFCVVSVKITARGTPTNGHSFAARKLLRLSWGAFGTE